MNSRLAQIARDLLRYHQKGLPTDKLAKLTGTTTGSIYHVLRAMPDAYISDWQASPRRMAVWRVVTPPPDAEPPPVLGAAEDARYTEDSPPINPPESAMKKGKGKGPGPKLKC